jgi:hypothetical protein
MLISIPLDPQEMSPGSAHQQLGLVDNGFSLPQW